MSTLVKSRRSGVSISPGGGEGIRTPDPRVANAVLCQLSYTPDKHFEIRISNFEISEIGCGGGI